MTTEDEPPAMATSTGFPERILSLLATLTGLPAEQRAQIAKMLTGS